MKRKDNIFTQSAMSAVPYNEFDLSHDVKMSFKMGQLVPCCVLEVVPGDKWRNTAQNMLRFAPLISPVMHKVRVTTDYYFVPNRLLWPKWDEWITGNSDVEAPFIPLAIDIPVSSLADYLGIPPGDYSTVPINVSPLSMAAYYKIWDEYYRDQNLQTEKFVELLNGDNTVLINDLIVDPSRRAWEHDYFTSCLPFAQKGDAVQIPLVFSDNVPVEFQATNQPGLVKYPDGSVMDTGDLNVSSGPSPFATSLHRDDEPAVYDPNGSLVVDIQADATDINSLRRAFALQSWLEKNARGGTRYTEHILAHFNVRSSDARLQRPEHIGRLKQNMVISEVLATAQDSEAGVPVGQMAGHGISVGGGRTLNYQAEEHGWIIGLINVQPDTAYMDGIHKSLLRFDRLDYMWPTFAHIGEQAVLTKELKSVLGVGQDPEAVFGYIPRYSEYRFKNSSVAGEMRTSLDFWHLARIFDDPDNPPVLNDQFIECAPSTRIFAVNEASEDTIFAHIFNFVSVKRKLPRFGIPSI